MHSLRILFSIIMLLVVIVFCVNNIQSFYISFLSYQLTVPLPLWTLLVAFFISGMIPIIAIELPRQASHFLQVRFMKAQIKKIEDQIRSVEASLEDPTK